MAEKGSYNIGLIGCGTVGGGVLKLLHGRAGELARRAGRPLRVRRIAVRRLQQPREVEAFLDADVVWTDRVDDVTGDPDLDLVVEVAGGMDDPRDWMVSALRAGKDVVTANKAALAFYGAEIFKAAAESGQRVYYEASVAGAIPIVEMLQNALVANRLTSISAILNGTCNYVLTRMEHDGMAYPEAVELAKREGFAEADPTLDVSGADTAHKLALLMGILFEARVPLEVVYTEGIDRISAEDIEFAKRFNYRIKLLAVAKSNAKGAWELRVHPALLPQGEILAQVQNEFNAASLCGDAVGPMLISGKGAGELPTASSVVADIVRAARGDGAAVLDGDAELPPLVPIEDVELRHYLRLTILDAPGMLGQITTLFGARGISIASIHQPDSEKGRPVPVVLLTHKVPDRVVSQALADLSSAGLLEEPASRIRIEGDQQQ